MKVCAYCRNIRPLATPGCPTCGAELTIPHLPTQAMAVQLNELLRFGRVSINEVREYFGLCAIPDPHFDARKT